MLDSEWFLYLLYVRPTAYVKTFLSCKGSNMHNSHHFKYSVIHNFSSNTWILTRILNHFQNNAENGWKFENGNLFKMHILTWTIHYHPDAWTNGDNLLHFPFLKWKYYGDDMMLAQMVIISKLFLLDRQINRYFFIVCVFSP